MEKKITKNKIYKIRAHYTGEDSESAIDIEKAKLQIRSVHTFDMNASKCPIYVDGIDSQKFTKAEVAKLAEDLGTTPSKLDPRAEDNYWNNMTVAVDSIGKTIDLSNSVGLREYLILSSHPEQVAIGKEGLAKYPGAKWVLINEDDDMKTASTKVMSRHEATTFILKYKDNAQRLRDMLSLYLHVYGNKRVTSPDTPIERINQELIIIADEKPVEFLNLIKNEDFDKQLLLLRGIQCGAVKERLGNYFFSFDESTPFAATFNQAINYLNSDANEKNITALKNDIESKLLTK